MSIAPLESKAHAGTESKAHALTCFQNTTISFLFKFTALNASTGASGLATWTFTGPAPTGPLFLNFTPQGAGFGGSFQAQYTLSPLDNGQHLFTGMGIIFLNGTFILNYGGDSNYHPPNRTAFLSPVYGLSVTSIQGGDGFHQPKPAIINMLWKNPQGQPEPGHAADIFISIEPPASGTRIITLTPIIDLGNGQYSFTAISTSGAAGLYLIGGSLGSQLNFIT